jgi:hypothetical protein
MSLTLSVQLLRRGSPTETFTVEGERVLIGTAAHCEIRLPPGLGAPEHVMLVHGLAGIHAEALAFDPTPTIAGAPFTVAPFPSDAPLGIGALEIRVSSVAVAASSTLKSKQEKTSPLVYLLAAVMIPYVLSDVLGRKRNEGLAPPNNPPALFAEAPTSCPHSEPASAAAFAEEQLELASSQRERRPFHASDGVQGVHTFRVAAACWTTAGDGARAEDARKAAVKLERELDESYRTHRVRLEHALSIENYLVARKEIRALLDLTRGQSSEYVSWLASTGRRLELLEGRAR